jgi:protein tyrosine phosphatase (PTP) superfamily phosphohydrolase (DUF442 family)
MQFYSGRSLRNFAGTLVTILGLILVSQSQVALGQSKSDVTIKNFGQMDDRFFRGGQPKEEEYKELAALGIKTVIDLTADPKPYEKPLVESLGMTYINIPLAEKRYPTEEATRMFLKVASDPNTGKFFVHCAGGRHRTGAMGAVYRYAFYNWNFDQVYSEMKKYDFYTSWGHGAFKDFVRDYYTKKIEAQAAGQNSIQGGAAANQ